MNRVQRISRWRRRCLPTALVVIAVCAGWAAAAAAQSGAVKPVLRIGASTDRNTADPNTDASLFGTFWPLMYEPLGYFDANLTFTPGLATSWHYLKAPRGSGLANKGFELTLRHNARFSDGTPVTAAAVVTWMKYASAQPITTGWGPTPKFEAIGKWTVRVHLTSPNPNMIYQVSNVSGNVSSPRAVANPKLFSTGSFGAGPYMLDPANSVNGDHYTLVPNPYYYDKSRIHWSKIVIRVVTNPNSMLQALQAGQLDVAPGDPTTAGAAAAAGLTVLHAPAGVDLFVLDAGGVKVKALADVRVRQALNYAVDRKTIASALLGKFGSPTSSFVTLDGTDPKYDNYYPYDPAKAKSLLAAAGYPNGFTVDPAATEGFIGVQGTPMAQAVAKYLAAVGVTLKIKDDAQIGDYIHDLAIDPTAMVWWQAGLVPAFQIYNIALKPGSPINHLGGGWKDKTLFNLWQTGSRASNPTPYWKQMTARETQQAYFLPIARPSNLFYVDKKVANVAVAAYRDGLPTTLWRWAPK